ncbi:MAG TPA: energy transducer TonB [Alphaproteobacteria bacterium]|nr:energy transducer TonB [Alphaproteobacteria bacterium]
MLVFTFALVAQSAPDETIYPINHKTSKEITPPKPVNTPMASFPPSARAVPAKNHIHRVVLLTGYVGKDGRYHDAKVVRSAGEDYDKEALDTVKTWEFSPCTKDGQPVNCSFDVEMAFNRNPSR